MKSKKSKSFSVELGKYQKDDGDVVSTAFLSTIGMTPARSRLIYYRFSVGARLIVGLPVAPHYDDHEHLLFQMPEDPLLTPLCVPHLRYSSDPLMAMAIAGPLRAAIALSIITEHPRTKLGKLAKDVDELFKRARLEKPGKKQKQHTPRIRKIIFGNVPDAEWRLLFATLTSVERRTDTRTAERSDKDGCK